MLNKQENEVMRAVYELCRDRENCLVSPYELLCVLPYKRKYTIAKLEKVLSLLEKDDYFDIIHSERKGEPVYVITMHFKGNAYERTMQQKKREMLFRVLIAVGSAVATGVMGIVVRSLFKL